jgi:hypothetical protein
LFRASLSLAERAIPSAGNHGRIWNGYAAYRAGNLIQVLEIFRVHYNFCQCGGDKMTPAMRFGLARGPVAVEDILARKFHRPSKSLEFLAGKSDKRPDRSCLLKY